MGLSSGLWEVRINLHTFWALQQSIQKGHSSAVKRESLCQHQLGSAAVGQDSSGHSRGWFKYMRNPWGSYCPGHAEHSGDQSLPQTSSRPGSFMIYQLQCMLTVERKDEGAVTEFRAMKTETEIPIKKRKGTLSPHSAIAALSSKISWFQKMVSSSQCQHRRAPTSLHTALAYYR